MAEKLHSWDYSVITIPAWFPASRTSRRNDESTPSRTLTIWRSVSAVRPPKNNIAECGVTPSRCPDQALHILELIMDCFGPKRCRDVLFGRAPDEGRGDPPLEKCRGAQAHEPKVPAKLQRGVPAGLDVGSRYGFPPCPEWNVVEQRLMDRRFHRRGSIERRNTLVTLVLNRRETRLAALAGVEGVPGKSGRVHAVDDRATSEHPNVWFLQAWWRTWDGGIRAFIIHGTARRAGGLRRERARGGRAAVAARRRRAIRCRKRTRTPSARTSFPQEAPPAPP